MSQQPQLHPSEAANLRAAPQCSALTPAAQTLLTGLPPEMAPKRLVAEFPHIANRIADLWRQIRQLDAYFDELLEDRRGNRRGFPFSVAMEISTLKEYYQTQVRPKKSSIWDGA